MIDELLQKNQRWTESFDKGDLPMPPSKHLAIVTCMDARIMPNHMLGVEEGDVHVIRNAGGRVRDALRSLTISEQLLGTDEIAVIHHTDCGMLTFSNQDLHKKLKDNLQVDADNLDFQPFSDLEQSVRDDVDYLRNSPLIPNDVTVRGFIYDVHNGKIDEVMN